jgi:predicted O-methyltransferase YrrM
MSRDVWSKVDSYIDEKLIGADEVLEAALAANQAGGLPSIDVSPSQGKLLYLLAKIAGSRRILEIGTLGGYSTIWLARAVPEDGEVVTVEAVAKHAEVARGNTARAGLAHRVDVRLGTGLEVLPQLAVESGAPFDFVFIDADKGNNAAYLDWAVKLGRSGTVIVCDNVIRDGDVIDASSNDPSIAGSRAAFDFVGSHPALEATAFQSVGGKGYDGMILAMVK